MCLFENDFLLIKKCIVYERSVEDELSAYVGKQDRVSASCRLTLLEEAELLDLTASGDLGGGGGTSGNNQSRWWSNVDNVALYNRRNLIKAALEGTGRPVTVAYPAGGGNAASSASYALTTGSSNSSGGAGGSGRRSSSAVGTGTSKLAMFDSVKDDTIVTIANGGDKSITSFSSRFHSLGYTRPDEQVGAQAISYLNKALDHGECMVLELTIVVTLWLPVFFLIRPHLSLTSARHRCCYGC